MSAIEIMEWFDATDVCAATVRAGLPGGYYCRIKRRADGAWDIKTKNGCKPSIRYYVYGNLDDAYAFGVRWAKRQQKAVAALTAT
jgi:hypothetical protein